MKYRAIVCFAVIWSLSASTASAFPPMPGHLKEGYKDDKEYKPFLEMVDGLKTKCDVCHIPGAEKKAKGHGLNDFGKVYHDRFEAKKFQAAQKEKKNDEALKLFKDAWEKSVKEKNADGKLYSDLIKEGKLPGKND